jgi:hypothetical protein
VVLAIGGIEVVKDKPGRKAVMVGRRENRFLNTANLLLAAGGWLVAAAAAPCHAASQTLY